ncbi:uncharacterized protein igsf9b [Engraulis encrasicolus]|uniref:uncharacterized protein igsf9b n=1 Tax=Engraulis encrasicolus TaxID=184585 RepID=UPI002FD350CD
MGVERLWALTVTAAALLSLLGIGVSAEPVVRGRVGGTAELDCSLAPPPSSSFSSPTGDPPTPPRRSNGNPPSRITPTIRPSRAPVTPPLHVVEWVRLGLNVPVLIKFGQYSPRLHPNYKGRVSLSGASLRIDSLSLQDEGWFECRILLLDRKTDEMQNGTWTFLSITAPPSFVRPPPSLVEVLLGDPLTLSCSSHGNPKPSVAWRKDGAPAEDTHPAVKVQNGTLSLETVTRETAGLYMCHVSNSEGNLTHTTQLHVKGPPVILASPEDTVMNISQDALLQCQADAYPSNLTYDWLKDGDNIYHIDSLKSRVRVMVDGTLMISSLAPEDAGNYTCLPTNGLLTPPSASATLTVKHPARVVRMPRETYLPLGMTATIPCPVEATPPMLYVNWTKDGDTLDLEQFPGWMVNSEGSVFITTANENAVGVYTCTPYNSYGTMGQSEPTKVILQDPPSFSVPPRAEYLQEVGRELMVPCVAHGDPAPNITWSKVGSAPRSAFSVLANGSLLLAPLSKDHQGAWECSASNRVATITAVTTLLVLGTSPHAVTSVLVVPDMHEANVTWQPGFDGGYTQKFSVWVKPTSRGKHEWKSVPVVSPERHLLVTGLLAGTSYQFSVLPHNKLGSGPFSEIVTVTTTAPPTEAPPIVVTTAAVLVPAPPSSLSANSTAEGILLQWVPPPAEIPPITGFVLQARLDGGKWITLNSSIHPNTNGMVVRGIHKDCLYDVRMLARRGLIDSPPSESLNISTSGMDMYPERSSVLALLPEPLLAGVIAGACFLLAGVVMSFVTVCLMTRRRARKRRHRRDDLTAALRKSPSPDPGSPTDSPDSVLKLKLCPPLSLFPGSSSSSDRSASFRGPHDGHHHHHHHGNSSGGYRDDARRQLLSASSSSPPPRYTCFETHLGGAPSPHRAALEAIARGPDGRFQVATYDPDAGPSPSQVRGPQSSPAKPSRSASRTGSGSGAGSGSGTGSFRDSPSLLDTDSEKRGSPLTLNGSPNLQKLVQSPGRVRALARHLSLSRAGRGCLSLDGERGGGASEALLDDDPRASFCSDGANANERRVRDSLRRCQPLGYHDNLLSRRPGYQPMESLLSPSSTSHSLQQPMDSQLSPSSTGITLLEPDSLSVSQSGRERRSLSEGRERDRSRRERDSRERDSLTQCLRLAQERQEMERELESYASGRLGGRELESYASGRLGGRERPLAGWEDGRRAKSVSPMRSSSSIHSPAPAPTPLQQDPGDPVWKPQEVNLRRQRPASLAARATADYRRGCYFGSTSSPVEQPAETRGGGGGGRTSAMMHPHPPSSHHHHAYIPWDISPVSSPTSHVPPPHHPPPPPPPAVLSLSEGNTPPHALRPLSPFRTPRPGDQRPLSPFSPRLGEEEFENSGGSQRHLRPVSPHALRPVSPHALRPVSPYTEHSPRSPADQLTSRSLPASSPSPSPSPADLNWARSPRPGDPDRDRRPGDPDHDRARARDRGRSPERSEVSRYQEQQQREREMAPPPQGGSDPSLLSVSERVQRIERSVSPRPTTPSPGGGGAPSRPTSVFHGRPTSPPPPPVAIGPDAARTRPGRSASGCSTLPYDQQRRDRRQQQQQQQPAEEVQSKPSPRGVLSVEEHLSASALPDPDREALRARSRRSEQAQFETPSCRASPLLLDEPEDQSDASIFSSRMSESLKARLAPPPARMSPVQTSAILEYLSMPGFIEMSVDDDPQGQGSAASRSGEDDEDGDDDDDHDGSSLLTGEPDVVPRNWETHTLDAGSPPHTHTHTQEASSPPSELDREGGRGAPVINTGKSSSPEELGSRGTHHRDTQSRDTAFRDDQSRHDPSRHSPSRDSLFQLPAAGLGRVGPPESRSSSTLPLLSPLKSLSPARHQAQRSGSGSGSGLAQSLVSAARSVAAIASRDPAPSEHLPLQEAGPARDDDGEEEEEEEESTMRTRKEPMSRERSPASRANKIASRIYQAPLLPFMRKSFSMGPNKSSSFSMGTNQGPPHAPFGPPPRPFAAPHRPFLRKSLSLVAQRWEPLEDARPYVTDRYLRDDPHLPHPHPHLHPDPRHKAYSLTRGPSSSSTSSTYGLPRPPWQAPGPAPHPASLERPPPAERTPYPLDAQYPGEYLAPPPPHPADRPHPMERLHPMDRHFPPDHPISRHFPPDHPISRGYPPDHPISRHFPPDHPISRGYPPDHPISRHYPPDHPISRSYPPDLQPPMPRSFSVDPPYPMERHYPIGSTCPPPPCPTITTPPQGDSTLPIPIPIPIPTRRDWPPDSRRHGAVFPDASRCPLTYEETLRAAQHKYVPLSPSFPLGSPPPRHPHPRFRTPSEPRRGVLLPRVHSWTPPPCLPSPHPHPPPPPPQHFEQPREISVGGLLPRELGVGGLLPREVEYLRERDRGEGGRYTSYASQSSGRGSVGPYGTPLHHPHGTFRQSVAMTPTHQLLGSPELPAEELRHRSGQRRNTSVDESYEWDSAEQCVDAEAEPEREGEGQGRMWAVSDVATQGGPQEKHVVVISSSDPPSSPPPSPPSPHHHTYGKGISSPPPLIQHGGSLSDARFAALRMEYLEFRRSQEPSTSSSSSRPLQHRCPSPDSDSDSNSALL